MGVVVVSNSADETANYLCSRMTAAGVEFVRLNTEATTSTCSLLADSGGMALTVGANRVASADVDVVWYRRPQPVQTTGIRDRADAAFVAAEWTAALEGFLAHVPRSRWVNHPASVMEASSKLEQLTRAARLGLEVPAWICTTRTEDALRFFDANEGCIVAKPLYSGYIERAGPTSDTVIYTSRVGREDLRSSPYDLGAPTLFQREVIGHDVRVTLVDDEVVAIGLSRDGGGVDIRRNNMAGVRYAPEQLPVRVKEAVVSLVRSYGLRFAAVDMMVGGGSWRFLEINPNGQWAWLDVVGGAEIYRSFLRAFGGAR